MNYKDKGRRPWDANHLAKTEAAEKAFNPAAPSIYTPKENAPWVERIKKDDPFPYADDSVPYKDAARRVDDLRVQVAQLTRDRAHLNNCITGLESKLKDAQGQRDKLQEVATQAIDAAQTAEKDIDQLHQRIAELGEALQLTRTKRRPIAPSDNPKPGRFKKIEIQCQAYGKTTQM